MPVALGTGEAVVRARGGRGLQLGGRARGREEGGGALARGELGLAAGSPPQRSRGGPGVGWPAGGGRGRPRGAGGGCAGGGTGVPEPSPRSAPPCRGLWE